MDHAEKLSTMVPPTPGQGLALTPNFVLSQDNYPTPLQASSTNKRQRPDSPDENITTFFKPDNFAKFIVVKSKTEKPITSLSPFVIEKQVESVIGTPKHVKKLKNQFLLIETSRKSQTENLLKMKTFFNLPVTVSEHNTLNSSKGIIRDRSLKGETEENILEYLKPQGVTTVKRLKIRKGEQPIETNTFLLTFNMVTLPKSLRIFYRMIPVEIYIPNPLRCFNCQKYNHHEDNCPQDIGAVCENCGMGDDDHITSRCKNPTKCVNCGKDHPSRSNKCEIWIQEKEIMRIKVTNKTTYLEAKRYLNTNQSSSFQKLYSRLNPQNQKQKVQKHILMKKTSILQPAQKLSYLLYTNQKKQSEQNTTASKTTSSSSQSGTVTSKSNNQQEKSRSRSKTRKTSRDNSKSPKPKQKPNVKLTRLQSK